MASRTTVIGLLVLLAMSGTGGLLIAAPAFAQTPSLAVTSPSPGTVFDRGQTVTLTATVTDAGSPVSGATVAANSPTGATISLGETTAGTYSSTYQISSTDPVGTWTITVVASSGGETAAAQLSVSISDALMVTFTSPPALTTFNLGEAAVIKSTVTYQDGSAVPPSASVTFKSPAGAAEPMALDSTDSSGKTWTGSHTIISSDLPSQGFDWPIIVAANVGGDTGTATEHVTLFSSLLVSVSSYGTSAYATPVDGFQAGQTVFVKATVALHDSTSVSSGTVTFEISGTSVATAPVAMAFSPSLNAWTGSYTILSTDALGVQTLSVSAADDSGNTGTASQSIAILSSSQGLAVSITSPTPGSAFSRGQTAAISALVTMGGSPVSGATVIATTPSGGSIALANTAGGDYSGSYTISSTDPVGTWTITVDAAFNGQSAASHESVTVLASSAVTVSTSLSPTAVSAGQAVYDTARLQGAAATAGGSVTYEYFGGTACSGSPTVVGSLVTVTDGVVPASSSQVFGAGSYGWEAVYSGDSTDNGATSACELLTVTPASPSLSTLVSPSSLTLGGSATDTATLTGGYQPTGTVTYSVFSDSACQSPVAGYTSQKVVGGNGQQPSSAGFTPSSVGTYYWTATYSGDANNHGLATQCGAAGETLTVVTSATSALTVSCSPSSAPPAHSAQDAFRYTCTATVAGAAGTPKGGVGQSDKGGHDDNDNHKSGAGFVNFTTSSATGSFRPRPAFCPIGPDGSCSVRYFDSSPGSVTITATYLAADGTLETGSTTFVIPKATTTTSLQFESSLTGSTPNTPIDGIPSGGAPWVVASGQAGISPNGMLRLDAAGLLISEPGSSLDGTTGPVTQVLVSLVCQTPSGVTVTSTDPVPLSPNGDAHINQAISLPGTCFAPVILVQIAATTSGPVTNGAWIAATGFAS